MKDWDKELAKIDRLLEKEGISTSGGKSDAPTPAKGQVPAKRASASSPVVSQSASPSSRGSFGVWVRTGLGVLLAASLSQWPYARECGWLLFGYLGAAGFVSAAGLWSASVAWRQRAAAPHVASVAVVFAGLAAIGLAVLPRLGSAGQAATWFCP